MNETATRTDCRKSSGILRHLAVAIPVLLMAFSLGRANAQSTGLSGYTYSTGTTALTQTVSTSMFAGANSDDINYDDITSQLFDIGFSFPFGGEEYTQFSVNSSGVLRLGNTTSNSCCTDFTGNDGAPRISGFLCDGYAKASAYAKTGLFGDTLRVVEFLMATYSDWIDNSRNRLWKFQIHLYRSGRVRIIQLNTGNNTTGSNQIPQPDWQVGMSIDNTDGWVVKPDYTAVHFTNSGEASEYFIGLENSGTVRFVNNRWFFFAPPSETLYAVRPPSGVRAASFSSTGFTLSWVGQADATKYVIRYGDSEVSTASTSYTFTGITPQRALTVQVATVVGTDTSSFTPLFVQMPYSLPYVQNFDSYTNPTYGELPTAWWSSVKYYEDYYGYSNLLNDGSYSQDPYAYLDNWVDGYKVCWNCDPEPTSLPGSVTHLRISNQYDKFYNRLHARAIAATPPFDVDANKLRISFKYMVEAHDNNGTESTTGINLRVGLIKNLGSDEKMSGTADWVTITSYNATKGWKTVSGLTYATSVAAGTYRLAFFWENTNDAEDLSVYIDDITIENRDCTTPDTKPTDLYATNLTSSGFRLNWSSTADASTTYTVFLDDEVAGTTAAGVKYFDISGLEPLSTHRLQVRAGSSCPSLPSDIMYIRTACSGSIDAPYSENFDDYSGAGVAGGTITPDVTPNNILPGCWTFNGLGTWSTPSYKFSTGVNTGKWIATTSNKSLTRTADNNGDNVLSTLKTMTFAFPFGGTTYTQFSFNEDGQIRLGSDEVATGHYGDPLSSTGANFNNPKVVGCGMDGQMRDNGTNTYGAWNNYSDTVTVIQYRMCPYDYIANPPGIVYLPYQVQLYKSGRILMAYQTMSGTAWEPSFQVGFATDATNVYNVASDGVSPSFHSNGSGEYLSAWPENGRWYEWKPSTASYPQAFMTSGVASSQNSLMLVNGRAEDVQHVVLPLVEGGDLSHLAFNFSYRQSTTATMVGELAIGTMSDPNDPSTFVLLRTLDRTTSWVTVRDTIGLHDPSPSQRYLAFRYTGGTAVGENTAIDNVSVVKVKCLPPSGLTVSNITTTSMRLSWTDHNDGASSYVIDLNGTEYVVAAGTNYRDFTGLNHGQPCRFIVKANCGGDGYSSTRTIYASTLCDDGVDLPYVENFDYYGARISTGTAVPADYPAAHTLPNCWTFIGMGATASAYPRAFITNGGTYRVAGNGLIFMSNTTAPLTAALPLPAGGVTTSQLHLHFQYKQYDTTSYTGTLVYGLMSDPSDPSTFVPLDTLIRSTSWRTIDCDMAAHPRFRAAFSASSRVHVAFKYIGGASGDRYTAIDDVRLTPLCLADLGASTTSTTCQLHWTDVSGGAYAFDIYEGETRLGGVAAGTTTFTVTSLTPGSTHTYRVEAVCGGCSCEPVSITVPIPCDGVLPYAEYFDSYGSASGYYSGTTSAPSHYDAGDHYLPDCWSFPGMSTSSSVYPQAFLSSGTNPVVRVSTPYGLVLRTTSYDEPMVAVINKDFGVPVQRMKLSFRYKVYRGAASSFPRVEWGVVTDVTNPSTFIPLGGGNSSDFVAVEDSIGNHSLPAGNLYLAFRFTKTETSSTSYYGAIDNVDITLLPECNVYGLTVAALTSSTATLSWENPLGTSWTYTVKNGDDVIASGITDTFYTVTGLTASTEYTLTVVPSCGGDGRSIRFTTDCDAMAYCDDFESYTANTTSTSAASAGYPGQRPACWFFPGQSGVYNSYPFAVVSSSSDCRSAGSNGMLLRTAGLAAPVVAVLPPVYSTPIAYMKLKLSYKYYSSNYGELSYGVMSNTYDTNTFIKIGTFPRTNASWNTDSVYIGHHGALFPDAYKRIVLRYSSTSDSYWAAIDNLCLEAQACPPVGGLAVSNITGTTADFTWVDHSGGTATYHFLVNGVDGYTTAAGATSHTLTGLLRGSVNSIGVYADCGGGSYGDTTYVQVVTPCAGGVDIPYTENFDRYRGTGIANTNSTSTSPSDAMGYPLSHTAPDCWTYFGLSASASSYPQAFISTCPSYNRDGDSVGHRAMIFKSYSVASKTVGACLPLANGGDMRRVMVSFDYKQSHTDVDKGVLSVGVMTDPDDPATYIPVKEFAKTTSWVHVDDTICKSPALPLGVPLYIAFRHGVSSGTTYYYTGLDNVQLTFLDGCLPPGGLTATSVSGRTATIAWIDNNSGTKPYHLLVNGEEALTTAAGATTGTLTGLPRGSYITVGAYADCGGGVHSDTVEIDVFVPCDGGVDFPYLETFDRYNESVYNTSDVISANYTSGEGTTPSTYPLGHTRPDCWTFLGLSRTTSTYPQIFIAKSYGYNRDGDTIGHRALMFKTQMTYKQQCYAVLPLANSGNLTRTKLSFDYKQSTVTADEGVLSYGVMTDPNDSTTYVNIATLAKVTAWTHIDANIGQAVGIPLDQPLWVAFRFGSASASTGTTTRYTGLDNVQLTLDDDACQAPGLGVSDNSTGTSVTLSWYDNNDGSCTYSVFKDDVSVVTGLTDTFYTFSGLTAYTDYTFKVQASCSGTPYSEITVRTTCASGIGLPYLEDFEGYTDGRIGVDLASTGAGQPTVASYPLNMLPNCWTFTGMTPALPEASTGKLLTTAGNFPNAYFTRNDSYSRGGTGVGKSLMFRTAYTGSSVFAALPLVNGGDLTRVLLSFRYIQNSTTVNVGVLSYGVMTNPADTGSYVNIKTLDKKSTWTVVTDTISMHALPAGPLYVAFRYGGKYYTTVQYTALDSVALREIPGCLRPGGLTASLDVAAGQAVLTWNDHNSDVTPTYSDEQDGAPLHNPTTSLTTDVVSGLVAGTTYTFKVIPSCDAEKYSTVTVQLPCDASGTLPYRENFDTYNASHGISTGTGAPTTTGYRYVDGANVMPDCWQFPNINRASTSSYPQSFLTTSGAYNGNTLLFKNNNTSLPIVASAAKDFGLPARQLGVFFKYKISDASYSMLEWGVTTNPADASSFIPLGANPRLGTGWVDVCVNLGDYPSLPSSSPVYLAFRHTSTRAGNTTAYYGYIENVKICDVTTTPTVAVANGSYTWTSGDGNAYTETGEYYYRHVVDSCPLVDTLRLTISNDCTPSIHVVPEVWPNPTMGTVTMRVVSSGDEYTDDPSALYCAGDTLELTAAPRNALRSKFLMWGIPPFGASTVRFVVPAGDTNVTAFFGPMKVWQDSINSQGTGGAVDYDEYYYTARPVGASYVTTHEGDVHIYDERGLAWLMSVANGLNGVQSRQFYYNRVYLHKKSDGKPYDMRGGQWVPLGSVREPFRGWFIGTSSSATDTARLAQGDRVVVRHLTVSTDADVAGFFGAVDTARISGLQLDSCFVRGGRFTGGLVGTAKDARIVNCAVTGAVGSVLVGRYASGGMAGEADGTLIDGVVTDAAYLGAVVYSGGAVGHGTSVVVRNSSLSYGNGGWPMEGLYAGGVAGWLDGVAPVVSSISPMAKAGASVSSLRNNYVRVKAYGSQYIGGLAGYASASEMENNYVWGTVQATAVGGVAAILDGRSRADRNYYERGSMSAAVVRARGGSDTGESADFSGTGNAVSLGHQVAGSTNLTQALNFWVRDNAGEGYFSWRSDLEGMNGGYPLFGEPDLIPVAATLTVEGCDSALYAGQWYRTGDQLTEHTLDSLLLTDTVLTVRFAVHPTARTTHRDTAQIGMVYRGYGFTLSANAAMLLRTTVDSLGSVTVTLHDTLQSVHGCDSVVTLMLTLQPKEGTLGIGDAGRQPQVVVRPNPATRLTTVEADAILWVELYDGAGRRLHRTAYDGVASATVDLEGLSSGVYLLRVGTPSGVVVEKVSKK